MDMPERFFGVATVNACTAGSVVKEVQPIAQEMIQGNGNLAYRRDSWSSFALSKYISASGSSMTLTQGNHFFFLLLTVKFSS
ncbi:hypothetical protein TNIN_492901 [Trichonephila inaurata madagascariensis]|uniref:Uncharacterized protein n=1 Tax=Trichonephila inaurata madagascariensis TaxID=2747483 RepID=A0A8X6XD92_9ARAC|nr:hypothetical protein TNIN_492901 [Trichonephila inaurata madagascariensis]